MERAWDCDWALLCRESGIDTGLAGRGPAGVELPAVAIWLALRIDVFEDVRAWKRPEALGMVKPLGPVRSG